MLQKCVQYARHICYKKIGLFSPIFHLQIEVFPHAPAFPLAVSVSSIIVSHHCC